MVEDDKLSSATPVCKRRRYFNWRLLTDSTFIMFALSNFLSCISYMVPFIYLPDLGRLHVGLDGAQTAVLILVLGVSNTLVRVVVGFVADLPGVDRLAVFSANLVFVGLASTFVAHYNSFLLLAVYAATFGVGIGLHTHTNSSPQDQLLITAGCGLCPFIVGWFGLDLVGKSQP